MSSNADYEIKKFGGLKSTILRGEGLVTEVTGAGIVYLQSKNIRVFSFFIFVIIWLVTNVKIW